MSWTELSPRNPISRGLVVICLITVAALVLARAVLEGGLPVEVLAKSAMNDAIVVGLPLTGGVPRSVAAGSGPFFAGDAGLPEHASGGPA